MARSVVIALFCVGIAVGAARWTAAQSDAEKGAANQKSKLATEQSKVRADYQAIEQLIMRLTDAYSKSDPKKAELLKQAYVAGKERRIDGKFESLIALLNRDQLYDATKSQAEVQQDLLKLLELLQSGDQERELADERERIKQYIARVTRIIKYEEQNKALAEGEADPSNVADSEGKNADRTGQLVKDIDRSEGKGKVGEASGKSDQANGDGKSDSQSKDGQAGESKNGKNDSGNKDSGKNESGKDDKGKSESGNSNQGDSKRGDSKSGDSKSGDAKSGDSKSGDSKSGGSKSEGGERGKNESGKSESGENKSGDSTSDDAKRGDSKSGDSKRGKSESGKSESGKSESGKSESGKSESGNSKSGDSKSGDTKSGNSKSGDSKSGDSESGDTDRGNIKTGDSKSGSSQSGDSKSGDAEGGDSESDAKAPSEDQWPDDFPAKKRLRAAEERMRQAKIKLERANRKGAVEDQKKAIEELVQAKKELEEILRQLREEEIERMLAQLEARFRKMLEMQVQVHAGTLRLDRVPESSRGRDDEVEALRLSRKEKQIRDDCDKALALMREEGSAVAFPVAAEQMRDDMEQVMHRLERANVGSLTQSMELEIIKALEEMIAALQKAQREIQAGGGGGGGGGSGEDQPLVDKLAEIRMIRTLQMRVNTSTQRYGKLLADPEADQADKPDLIEAVRRLADREQKIKQITRDIVTGRNQ
jgi:hypothetical protein